MFSDFQFKDHQPKPLDSKSFVDNRGTVGAKSTNKHSETMQRKHNQSCVCSNCAPTVQRKVTEAVQKVNRLFVFGGDSSAQTVQRSHNPSCGCGSCGSVTQMKVDKAQVVQLYTTSRIGGYDGRSGNEADTVTRLNTNKYGRAIGNIFKQFGVQNHNNHGVFSCGEPHALSKLVEARGNGALNTLKSNPVVDDAMNYHGHGAANYIAPCPICRQWVKGAQGNHRLGPAVTTNTMLSSPKYQNKQL